MKLEGNAEPGSEMRIVVRKSKRKLELLRGSHIVSEYDIALGRVPEGDKAVEGDGKTPEGEYYIFGKNPESKYHLGLGISYPSIEDAERGLLDGLLSEDERDLISAAIEAGKMPPQKTRLGGAIYIHGGGNNSDWTEGCVALNDSEMDELYRSVIPGTAVTILP